MNCNSKLLRRISLLLLISLCAVFVSGCRRQVVERVGVLPDRPTQFVAHNTETETPDQESKSWDVQNADELRLFSSEIEVTEAPSAYYYNNKAY